MSNSYKNSYIVEQKQLVSLSVSNTGYQKCTALYQWGPGIRDHYLIHHVISGTGYYHYKNKLVTLHPGDTFLVYPFEEIYYYADDFDPWEYCWVGFTGTDASSILRATDFSKVDPVIYKHETSSTIAKHFLHIYEARGNGFENALEMTGRLYTALAFFIQTATTSISTNTYETYAKKGMEYIHSHYLYPLTIEEIAEYVGISRSHLVRSFQSYCIQSPKSYLTDFRIGQACILLQHSTLSVTAIGKSVGFEDTFHFSKAFKKAKGLSPLAYIKTNTTPK